MDWGSIANAINTGIEVTANTGLGLANVILQNRYYKQQQAWQQQVYEEQKRLNDPVYIMSRRRAAGLNPYGGDFQQMSVGQPTPVSSAPVAEAFNGLQGSISRSADKAFNAIAQRLAKKQLELQENKIDYENLLTEEQINQLRSQTAYQDIVNEIAENTKGSQVELSKLQVDNLLSQILLNNTNLEFLPDKLKAEIKKLDAETNKIDYDWREYMPAMLLLNQRLGNSSIALNQSNIEKIAEEITALKADESGWKELNQQVDKMDDGISKTFVKVVINVLRDLLKNTKFSKK